jgi:hypothetical protein
MPEMFRYSGRAFQVLKRIDKVIDNIDRSGFRQMTNAVILDGVRCDGGSHGGCQAMCQIIWKEAWLVRLDRTQTRILGLIRARPVMDSQARFTVCTTEDVIQATRAVDEAGRQRFGCQGTKIKEASSPLAWWDVRQDWRDVRSGNVTISQLTRAFCFWVFTLAVRLCRRGSHRLSTLLVWSYNRLQSVRGADPYAYARGVLDKTPQQQLHLAPGELVRVKSYEEILATLNKDNRNRGLWFDAEMMKYCGGVYRVLSRVEKIINPKNGSMLTLQNDCIVLEGVTVRGDYYRFYAQNEYPMWREIWLERVPGPSGTTSLGQWRQHAEENG